MPNRIEKEEIRSLLKEWSEAAKDVTRAVGSWRRIAILDIFDTLGSQTAGEVISVLKEAEWSIPRSEVYRHLKILYQTGLIDQDEPRKEYNITSYGSLILDTCKRAALKMITGEEEKISRIRRLSKKNREPILELKGFAQPTAVEKSVVLKILEEYGCNTSESIIGLVKVILSVAREEGKVNDYDLIGLLEDMEESINLRSIVRRATARQDNKSL